MELGLEANVKLGEVADFPSCEGPGAFFAVVADADEEVEGVVLDFLGASARLKVECAEGGCLGFPLVEFGVEVGVCRFAVLIAVFIGVLISMGDEKIGIPRALCMALGVYRD